MESDSEKKFENQLIFDVFVGKRLVSCFLTDNVVVKLKAS